jgi:hypothetical protein
MRSKHAHQPVSQSKAFTITPAPKHAVEAAHAQTVQFLSELRVGLMADSELDAAISDRQTRLHAIERLPKMFRDTSSDYQQLKADLLAFSNEVLKRQLSRLQHKETKLEEVHA